MNKLSEYIPLIVILASLIISVVGKKKKQANRGGETTLPGMNPGELIDMEKTPQASPALYRRSVEDKPKKQIIQSSIKEEIKSFAPANMIIEPEEEDNQYFTFEEEDLRNAIIYAEIINKREW